MKKKITTFLFISLRSMFEFLVYPWTLYHAHPNAGVMMSNVPGWRKYTAMLKEEYDKQMRGEQEEDVTFEK